MAKEVDMDSLNALLDMEISLEAVLPHKNAVLALAADRVAETAGMSYEHAKAALTERETLGSTGLGRGVAMPHAMSPHCLRPAAVLIGLSCPVDFDAPDDADVDVVLALVWPSDRVQEFLRVSATTSRILLEPTMLRLVRRAASPDVIRQAIHFSARVEKSRACPDSDDAAGRAPPMDGRLVYS